MNLVTLVRGNRVPERRPLTIDTYSSVARRCYDIFLLLIIDYFSSKLSRVSASCSNEHYLYGYHREELYLLEDTSDENLFFLFFLRLLRVALFQTLIYFFSFVLCSVCAGLEIIGDQICLSKRLYSFTVRITEAVWWWWVLLLSNTRKKQSRKRRWRIFEFFVFSWALVEIHVCIQFERKKCDQEILNTHSHSHNVLICIARIININIYSL